MDWQNEVLQILVQLLIAVLTAFAGLAVYGLKMVVNWLKIKIENALDVTDKVYADKILSIALDAIETAVVETNQTYVDNLKQAKEDGKLTKEEISQAMQMSYSKAKQLMGDKIYEALKDIIPNVNDWITAKIEYYVNIYKNK